MFENDNSRKQAPFYVLSMGKFALLYLCTSGLFVFYWFYQHWFRQVRLSGEAISPVARTIFLPVFVLPLIKRVRALEQDKALQIQWKPDRLISVYFLGLASKVFIAYGVFFGFFSPAWALLDIALFFVNFYVFYQLQLVINRCCDDPFGSQDQAITTANKAFIVLGLVMWMNWFQNLYEAMTQPKTLPEAQTQGQTTSQDRPSLSL